MKTFPLIGCLAAAGMLLGASIGHASPRETHHGASGTGFETKMMISGFDAGAMLKQTFGLDCAKGSAMLVISSIDDSGAILRKPNLPLSDMAMLDGLPENIKGKPLGDTIAHGDWMEPMTDKGSTGDSKMATLGTEGIMYGTGKTAAADLPWTAHDGGLGNGTFGGAWPIDASTPVGVKTSGG